MRQSRGGFFFVSFSFKFCTHEKKWGEGSFFCSLFPPPTRSPTQTLTYNMRVDITGEQPDTRHLHSGHMVMDTFDLYIILYVLGLVICGLLVCCTSIRLFRRRNDPARLDAKKRD